MVEVSDIKTEAPKEFSTPLQAEIYRVLDELKVPFQRVDNSPSYSMEDAVAINARLGGKMAKNVLLTNRQQTRYWLLVMEADKPFVTRDFGRALEIPRVSFAPSEKLAEMLGVEHGAANILCGLLDRGQEPKYQLVIDRDILGHEDFMLPDGTVTCHLKLSTRDLMEKLVPYMGQKPTIIDL